MNTTSIITELSNVGVTLEVEGDDRIAIEAPAGTLAAVKDLVRPHKAQIIALMQLWKVATVYMEAYAGRLWLSSHERAFGIPLDPGRNGTPTLDAQTVGALLAWALAPAGEGRA